MCKVSFNMKIFRILLIVFIISGLAQAAFSQRKLSGTVVEVIDGKTAVVEIAGSGKLTVILQYIEIPEPEQPLHTVVKEHLEKLILGKNVLVVARGIMETSTVAQLFSGGADVSQQMLRDGAAWYALPEKSGQNAAESGIYQNNEAQAKAERRGVWSIGQLQPPWEFRAEKQQRARAEELAKLEEIKKQSRIQKAAKPKLPPPPAEFSNFEMWKAGRTAGMWDDMQLYMTDREFNENGLFIHKVPQYNLTFILTKDASVNLSDGRSRPKLVCGAAYMTGKPGAEKQEKELFGIACKSESEKQSFKNSNQLLFTIGGKKITGGKAIHLGKQSDKRFNELMVYFLDRDGFTKIAAANNVQIKIGGFSGDLPENFHTMLKHLVLESAKDIK